MAKAGDAAKARIEAASKKVGWNRMRDLRLLEFN
jgi:hypothetical protein